jgi:hypothetical protein
MPSTRLRSPRALAFAVALLVPLVAGCGGRDEADADDPPAADTAAAAGASADGASAGAAESNAADASAAGTSAQAPLEVADIDRWQRGIAGELEAVRRAGDSLRIAKTAEDSTTALFAANEMSTRAAGARAAGVDEARYQRIRATFSPLVAQMAPIEQEMNVAQMPPAMVAQLKQGRADAVTRASAELPTAVVEALRPRAAELRQQDRALLAARLEAAGMVRR